MKITETLKQIDDILAATPLTREEIAALWKKEDDEKMFKPDVIFALSAALDYVRTHDIYEGFLWEKYEKRLKKLMKEYKS